MLQRKIIYIPKAGRTGQPKIGSVFYVGFILKSLASVVLF